MHQQWERDILDGILKLNYLAPREHGKTRILAEAYVLWRVCLWLWLHRQGAAYRDEHIAIMSVTQDMAESRLRQVRFELENNAKLIADFGPFNQGDEWTEARLIFAESQNQTDPNVFATGIGGVAPGWRLTCLILDDTTDPRHVWSKAWRDKQQDFLEKVMEPALLEDGVEIAIHTPYHNDDLPARLKKRGDFTCRTWKAMVNEAAGERLWPEAWPLLRLMEIKRRRPKVYSQQYQCEPFSDEDLVFQPPEFWHTSLQAAMREQVLEMKHGVWFMRGTRLNVVTGVDPALKGKDLKTGSRMAIISVGYNEVKDKTSVIRPKFVLGAHIGRWGFMKGCEEIKSEWEKWRADEVCIEEVGFQAAYRDVLSTFTALPARGIHCDTDKIQRIVSTVQPPAHNHQLKMLPDHRELIDEWTTFPGDTMDGMDGLEIAVRRIDQGQARAIAAAAPPPATSDLITNVQRRLGGGNVSRWIPSYRGRG